MTGPKLNERPVLRSRPDRPARPVEGTATSSRSVARYVRVSAYKVREVLDLVRGQDADRAQEILRFAERDAATLVGKVLASAVANAEHVHGVPSEELFVSACFADEGPTLKRWRPRARGRATRIRKRTCHVTLIVTRLPENELRKRRASRAPDAADRRRRRQTGRTPSPERERRVRASR
ncbi:MAG: 50S ribosomal protein L22, partial [Acidimicrobiales bacterium]